MRQGYYVPDWNEVWKRICMVTMQNTQEGVGMVIEKSQANIAMEKRRGKIPTSWLFLLLVKCGADPNWVLTGKGGWRFRMPVIPEGEVKEYPSLPTQEEVLAAAQSEILNGA